MGAGCGAGCTPLLIIDMNWANCDMNAGLLMFIIIWLYSCCCCCCSCCCCC